MDRSIIVVITLLIAVKMTAADFDTRRVTAITTLKTLLAQRNADAKACSDPCKSRCDDRHPQDSAIAGARPSDPCDKAAADLMELRAAINDAEDARSALAEQIVNDTKPSSARRRIAELAELIQQIDAAKAATFGADELLATVKAYGDVVTEAEREADAARRTYERTWSESGHTDNPTTRRKRKEWRNAQAAAAAARGELSDMEEALRAQGVADRTALKRIDDTIKANLDVDLNTLATKRKELNARVAQIEKLIPLPAENSLYDIYEDESGTWLHRFSLGVEFDSAGSLFNKGFPRLGYTNVVRLGGSRIPESHPRAGFANYGFNLVTDALLTSTAEQPLSSFAKGGADVIAPCPADKPCPRKAVEAETRLFWRILRTRRSERVRHYFGPVFAAGLKFVDAPLQSAPTTPVVEKHAAYRLYGGTHLGFARDAYSELLVGRSSGVNGLRLELRGEAPVVRWNGSRLLLGAITNVGMERSRSDDESQRDTMRVYLSYELDLLKILGIKAPD